MTNSAVKTLQEKLKSLGYMTANATGYFGTATRAAVEAFQRTNNLDVDGIAGQNTQAALYSGNAVSAGQGNTSTGSGTTTYATLRYGQRSTLITTMQEKLRELGYMTANATGYFGTATQSAVLAFQRANGLVVDGIAGQNTLAKLYSGTAVSAGSSSSGSSSSGSSLGAGKIQGPSASEVKLLHWFDEVRPTMKNGDVFQIFDPATNYTWKLKALSLGNHADSEPLTAEDTMYMNAAFGGITTWTPKVVWAKIPNGTWVLCAMHNTPHLSGNIDNNNFDGHLCVHFLRDMDECKRNDPNYGVQNQNAIRAGWKALTGETVL